ncbi:peptidylprolyl isomerase [Candidatus Thiodiazotropha sp. CDECU1]|uniref:peptidylprolyl isomerase n=1 Tax=Candidatus Thiodiazotropha sp. CDECU1 TaxID=3065865 RepID=UPI00292EDC9C|nr:peptidylprolyl isomerase [Candidatus Thiodiazotropha sp. CDECU1]
MLDANTVRDWLREPMLHFIVAGLVVFIVDSMVNNNDVVDENQIVINNRVKSEIILEFKQKKSRDPSQQETDKMLDAWLRNELLYRKGLDMGLAENDSIIRDRVIQKTVFLFRSLAGLKEPSMQQLKEWYQEKGANYQKQPGYDFEHILIREQEQQAKQNAEEILNQLVAGKAAPTFNHAYHKFVARNRAGLSVTFGDEFVEELEQLPTNEWKIVKSKKGWHVLRIQSIKQQPLPGFEQIKPLIRKDWQRKQQSDQVVKLIEELRNSYTILRQSS